MCYGSSAMWEALRGTYHAQEGVHRRSRLESDVRVPSSARQLALKRGEADRTALLVDLVRDLSDRESVLAQFLRGMDMKCRVFWLARELAEEETKLGQVPRR